ncbi:MAG TPA: acetylglutamate kinase [Actinomycetota bacterium]|nr:acetylglutamate kinase [Actinomycetota bacterium]
MSHSPPLQREHAEAQAKARVLTEALPYIRQWSGKRVVVKAGGETVDRPGMLDSLARDVALMRFVGLHPILVHGGGRQISDAMKATGRQPVFVGGRRVTDAETIAVVRSVLMDINARLVHALQRHGAHAFGLSGEEGGLLATRRAAGPLGEDLGFVGEVANVDTSVLDFSLSRDLIPVVAPVGAGPDGPYNINADLAASALAAAVGAQKLVLLTNIEGLYLDLGDRDSLISETTVGQLEKLLDEGVLTEGMIPKIAAVIEAMRAGVPQAHILDGRVAHALLLEVFTEAGVGTMVLP